MHSDSLTTMRWSDVRVGHVYLAKAGDGSNIEFVRLVEALQREGIEQHLVMRDRSLIGQMTQLDGVSAGPAVHSAITASCLVPPVDVAHIHDPTHGQAGLLLTLTRSIPYVLTHRGNLPNGRNPVLRAIYRRAASVVCADHADIDLLRHFEPGLVLAVIQDSDRPAAIRDMIRVYQNSQRMPMAGNNGSQ